MRSFDHFKDFAMLLIRIVPNTISHLWQVQMEPWHGWIFADFETKIGIYLRLSVTLSSSLFFSSFLQLFSHFSFNFQRKHTLHVGKLGYGIVSCINVYRGASDCTSSYIRHSWDRLCLLPNGSENGDEVTVNENYRIIQE